MDEVNFTGKQQRYRLVRNNSTEFPYENNEIQCRTQRRPSFIRETCLTPDSCNKSFLRFYDQDQSSFLWNLQNSNKAQNNCKCSTSTPKIHQLTTEYDPRHEGFARFPRSNSPVSSIPSYFSLKTNSNKKKDSKYLYESKTLGRCKGKGQSSLIISSDGMPNENVESVKNCHSERCLNWVKSSNDFESMENQMKELDMNIELLKWKKKHLENIHHQKLQNLQQGADVYNSHHSESPPPLSDIMKPDVSIDDGFESVADTCNNQSAQNIAELEAELRRQHQKVKFCESMLGKYKLEVDGLKDSFKKQENKHQMEVEKMKNFYETRIPVSMTCSVDSPSGGDFGARATPVQVKGRATRPKSFKRELFPPCKGGCDALNSEVLALRAELIIKDQHLKKLRVTLKELSLRHNELLDLHMMLVKSHARSGFESLRDSTDLIEDLSLVVEDAQKVFSSIGQNRPGSRELSTTSPVTTPSAEQLTKLHQSIEKLKSEVKKKCTDRQTGGCQ